MTLPSLDAVLRRIRYCAIARSGRNAVRTAVLLMVPGIAWCGPLFGVPAELWEQPRSAQAVLAQPILRQAIAAWFTQPASPLVVHHGNGEETQLRAEELRGWLIALAVEAARIELRGDMPGSEEIRIEVNASEPRGKK